MVSKPLNVPFLVWIGEIGASVEIGNEKKRHIPSFLSVFSDDR